MTLIMTVSETPLGWMLEASDYDPAGSEICLPQTRLTPKEAQEIADLMQDIYNRREKTEGPKKDLDDAMGEATSRIQTSLMGKLDRAEEAAREAVEIRQALKEMSEVALDKGL